MIPPTRLVDFAVVNAKRQAMDTDVAAGLVAALRSVRSILADREGFASVCALDDGIRSLLMAARLHQRFSESELLPRALPEPSETRSRRIAVAILDDVVTFIMIASGPVPVGLTAGQLTDHLLGHLIGQLGGPPDTDMLLAAIRKPGEVNVPAVGSDPWTVVRVH
jgi:hypothetical protein